MSEVIIISYINGKLKLQVESYEIIFQRKGKNSVKIVNHENHAGKNGNFVPKKYRIYAEKKALKIICNDPEL